MIPPSENSASVGRGKKYGGIPGFAWAGAWGSESRALQRLTGESDAPALAGCCLPGGGSPRTSAGG